MTKSDLQKLIRQEVASVVRTELQRIVKPLVQEAVAGALGGLLGEGIARGVPVQKTPQILTPNVPGMRAQTTANGRQAPAGRTIDPSVARRRMASKFESMMGSDMSQNDTARFMGTGVVGDILTETAREMSSGTGHVDSILDATSELDTIAPEIVDVITRDYSGLMDSIKRRGQVNG